MLRYECLQAMTEEMAGDELCVVDMGNVSNEWHAVGHRDGNLYNLQMGIPFALGLGLALALPERRVIACQGDGSLLENLGVLVELAQARPQNLLCLVFDNQCYEAVGRHPTPTGIASLAGMAREAGIPRTVTVDSLEQFRAAIRDGLSAPELHLVVAKIEVGTAQVEPMALYGEVESTCRFVRYVERSSGITVARPNQSAVEDHVAVAMDGTIGASANRS